MKELIPGRIYFGGVEEASEAVKKGQVLIDVRVKGLEQTPSFPYKHCPIADDSDQITESIKYGVSQIMKEYANGKNIYFHCGSGNGRACVMATVTLLELGKAKSLDVAECMVKQLNPSANIRPAMHEALEQLYSNRNK